LFQVTVETTEINFDMVGFIEPVTRNLTVANTGQVPVQFEFIKKLNDKSFCKPWLSVEPSSGFIMPGDKSDLNVEVYVDKKTAGTLNSGSDQVNSKQKTGLGPLNCTGRGSIILDLFYVCVLR